MYNYYRKKFSNDIPYELICKIVEEVKKINTPIRPFPDYVLEFFDEIKVVVKTARTQEKQKKILEDYDNEEHFMSEINFNMNESLNRFFGITDKDMEDFNNIKIINKEMPNLINVNNNDKNEIAIKETNNDMITKIIKQEKKLDLIVSEKTKKVKKNKSTVSKNA